MRKLVGALAVISCAIGTPAMAQGIDLGGRLGGEVRYFPSEGLYPGQFDHVQPSFFIEPELRWEDSDRTNQIVLIPFFRLDGQDDERTHFDLREAFYRHNGSGWSLTAGLAKVFWGRTESRHLVDIINQTDSVEDIDEEDKLGQPMLNLTVLRDWGVLDFYLMSGFRERTFAGVEGRPRFGFVVDTDDPIYTSSARRAGPDFAARYGHYLGNWDFGVSVFHGTSREPRFALTPGGTTVLPVYDRITQGSVDLQYTKDAWLWKFEGIARVGHGDTFFASVAGVEYTFYQVFGTGADLGLLAEYQYDGREEGVVVESFGPALAAPITVANNDVFAGARLAFNDTQNGTIIGGLTVDAEDASIGVFFEASRRIGTNWTADLEARLFMNADPANPVFAFRDDDFLTFRLTRYF